MRTNVVALDLTIRRRVLVAYAGGMMAYAFIIVALYPQFKNTTSLNSLTKGGSAAAALFGLVGSLTSPAGWLNANIYAMFLPLVMLLLTIGYGAAALAGQAEDGTLCLLAVLPLRRDALVGQKAAAIATQAFVVALAVGAVIQLGPFFQLRVSPAHVFEVSATTFFLGLDFGLIALAVGAITGRRGSALGVASALAVVSYLVSSLAPVVAWIRPARYGSLFYWSVGNEQISRGASAPDLVVLVLAGVVALIVATRAFRILDVH
jgi:ABC-2 type transport system permease protein